VPTYAEIAHLVHDIDAQKDVVHLHFCADCGQFEQTVTVSRRTAGSKTEPSSSRSALLSWLKAAFRRVLKTPSDPPIPIGQDELEDVTLRAFSQIADSLTLIDGRWIGQLRSEHPSEFFERQLSAAPITEPYDLEVLVRVLLEVSRSDSDCRAEERAFLQEIVPDEKLVARLHKAPRIKVAELAEISSVMVKQTVLMLAWAMAYADGSLDPVEMDHLHHLCRGLMLPEARVRELQLAAKLALLDRYLDANRGKVSPAELREKFDKKARAWGVCEGNLCKLRAWYPKDFPVDSKQSQPLSAEDEAEANPETPAES
jgi:tellurite resistance protein